ncbi:NAD(P)H-binding protein [Streptomyces mobaraensis NBRC 13819 = DSM 40847]|uniref:NAD-dependent epimerase/dehydratase n=1 Tax=Streptomyces mobaraensis (strain ATCC 29032 / DSM 40847 / JCM 4168 / NBRC 13819 / NCIMB 11159 / IPCR 16-22) TaxID=1223523 RepID=M3C6P8_STRM1|nr:NAD(P)H-binding protein [Streptomyces mobaraensis]EME99611.1 NAD-dependent epimerase/dehydratase [Streptomyces mobaraensis NBRC 13819 = DSM 40847]QTT74565.1 NAD(P)H-binding protein [Streptomyces mobaraensis NBRC 13819 = DSM 40847]
MAKIALFGANGTIGSRVLREALDRGHQVTAVVRDPAKLTEQHPNLTVTTGDVLDPQSVAAVAQGQDVVVSAVGGGDGPGHIATIKPAAESLVAGLRTLGDAAPRLIAVGGAGSLRTPDGKQVWDAEGLPEFLLQIMHAHGDALDFYRTVTDVRWTNLSPAGLIEPGERTGTYRTGLDDLVVDENGKSRISVEDYAVALVDEIEEPRHIGERFTVAD